MTQEKLQRIGEVIDADTRSFDVQCYTLWKGPSLGTLVRAGEPAVVGVVSEVRTESLDPSRPAIARGQDAVTEDDIYSQNPQLAQLLRTRFHAMVVGCWEDGAIRVGLPAAPPRLHAFVFACDSQHTAGLTRSLDFLRLLLNSNGPASDEVVVACLRQLGRDSQYGKDFLLRAGKALAQELAGQTPRLNGILRRLA